MDIKVEEERERKMTSSPLSLSPPLSFPSSAQLAYLAKIVFAVETGGYCMVM